MKVRATLKERLKSSTCKSLKDSIIAFEAGFHPVPGHGPFFIEQYRSFLTRCEQTIVRLFPLESEEDRERTFDELESLGARLLFDRIFLLVETPDEDAKIEQKVRRLAFIEPTHLGLSSSLFRPGTLQLVFACFGKIAAVQPPIDKLNCLVNGCKLIAGLLKFGEGGALGADDFVPAFIFCFIKAAPVKPVSTLAYIKTYRAQGRLSGESDYFLTAFESALEFVGNAGAEKFGLSEDEFVRNMEKAEKEFEEGRASDKFKGALENTSKEELKGESKEESKDTKEVEELAENAEEPSTKSSKETEPFGENLDQESKEAKEVEGLADSLDPKQANESCSQKNTVSEAISRTEPQIQNDTEGNKSINSSDKSEVQESKISLLDNAMEVAERSIVSLEIEKWSEGLKGLLFEDVKSELRFKETSYGALFASDVRDLLKEHQMMVAKYAELSAKVRELTKHDCFKKK